MSTSKLTLFDGALRILGQPFLSSLTEDREARHYLDKAWDENAIDNCLEEGNWNFATRASKIEYDSSVTPDFGFNRAFNKPSDWMKTIELTSDEFFMASMTDSQYADEREFWFASIDTIYVRYVSNDSEYGNDLSLWPQSFIRFFELYLADAISHRVVQDKTERETIKDKLEKAMINAKSKDAVNEGVKFHAPGSWTDSRRSPLSRRRDRGSRSRLTG